MSIFEEKREAITEFFQTYGCKGVKNMNIVENLLDTPHLCVFSQEDKKLRECPVLDVHYILEIYKKDDDEYNKRFNIAMFANDTPDELVEIRINFISGITVNIVSIDDWTNYDCDEVNKEETLEKIFHNMLSRHSALYSFSGLTLINRITPKIPTKSARNVAR